MTQVWMIRNSDTDIHLFNRYEHLKPSVEISYSRCTEVIINERREDREVFYEVSGKRDGQWFNETVCFIQLPVWTEPSHL